MNAYWVRAVERDQRDILSEPSRSPVFHTVLFFSFVSFCRNVCEHKRHPIRSIFNLKSLNIYLCSVFVVVTGSHRFLFFLLLCCASMRRLHYSDGSYGISYCVCVPPNVVTANRFRWGSEFAYWRRYARYHIRTHTHIIDRLNWTCSRCLIVATSTRRFWWAHERASVWFFMLILCIYWQRPFGIGNANP